MKSYIPDLLTFQTFLKSKNIEYQIESDPFEYFSIDYLGGMSIHVNTLTKAITRQEFMDGDEFIFMMKEFYDWKREYKLNLLLP